MRILVGGAKEHYMGVKIAFGAPNIYDTCSDSVALLAYFFEHTYDAVFLFYSISDLNFKDLSEVFSDYQTKTPVYFIFKNNPQKQEIITLLSLGFFFYFVEPLDYEIIKAHVLSKIKSPKSNPCLSINNYMFDLQNKTATYLGREIYFRPKEFLLLEILLLNKGKVVTKDRLLESLWELGVDLNSNSLSVHMCRVRKKLSKNKKFIIKTIYGFGYTVS